MGASALPVREGKGGESAAFTTGDRLPSRVGISRGPACYQMTSKSAAGPASEWTPRRVVATTLVVLAVLVGFVLVYLFGHVLLLLFMGIVLSTALKPLTSRIQAGRLPRNIKVTAVYVLVVSLLLGALVVGLPLLLNEAQSLIQGLPARFRQIEQRLPETFRRLLHEMPAQLLERPVSRPAGSGSAPAAGVATALSYTSAFLRAVLSALAILLFAYYWTLHEQRSLLAVLHLLPVEQRDQAREVIEAMEAKVGGYLRGQGMLCLAVGTLSLIAYFLIGLPYALPLGVLAGILEAVPFFGPTLGAIPAVVVATSLGVNSVIWVIGASVLIQFAENHLLVPRIMNQAVGVNPVVTLLAIAGFGALFGIWGAILAIPLAAILQTLFERFLFQPEVVEQPPPGGRDTVSRIRYQTRELVQDVRHQLRNKSDASQVASEPIAEAIELLAQDLERSLAAEADRQKISAEGIS